MLGEGLPSRVISIVMGVATAGTVTVAEVVSSCIRCPAGLPSIYPTTGERAMVMALGETGLPSMVTDLTVWNRPIGRWTTMSIGFLPGGTFSCMGRGGGGGGVGGDLGPPGG